MRTIPREPSLEHELGLRRDYTRTPLNVLEAYLIGASHDGTWNEHHKTFRYTQREKSWLELIQQFLKLLGRKSWIYREGSQRSVWALETTFCPPTQLWHLEQRLPAEWVGYIRGFFDAEGGVPRQLNDRFYLQFVQKNRPKLMAIKNALGELGIQTGSLHNPSKRIDPEYWRFFIATRSHEDFIQLVGSWHPRKSKIFERRMKI